MTIRDLRIAAAKQRMLTVTIDETIIMYLLII